MRRHLVICTLAALVGSGCASSPGGAGSTGVSPTRDIILAPEIVAARVMNAYDAVMRLRPEYLRARGPVHPRLGNSGPVVYLDDIQLGSVETLRTISVDKVTAIRYLRPTEANVRLGPHGSNGAIVVSTGRSLD